MSCRRFGPAIAAHAAGAELDAAARRHLSECARCRRMLDAQAQLLAELDAELARNLSISASPDFTARVARVARAAGGARAHWIPAPVWAGVGMAAVMAIMLAVWVLRAPGGGAEAIPRQAEAPRPGAEDVMRKPESTEVSKAAPSGAKLAATRRRGARSPDRPRIVSAELPVVVEPSRAMAIQRFRELMIEGRLDEQMLPPPVRAEAVLTELSIAPLEIAEIRVRDVEIVGRPPAAPERQ